MTSAWPGEYSSNREPHLDDTRPAIDVRSNSGWAGRYGYCRADGEDERHRAICAVGERVRRSEA